MIVVLWLCCMCSLLAYLDAFVPVKVKYSSSNTFLQKKLYNINPSNSVDVSDLNITMSDLEKPLDDVELEFESSGVSERGYYSWVESLKHIEVSFSHPGIRGQPKDAILAEFTSSTLTISIFGYVTYSAVLEGPIIPEESKIEISDGDDNIPKIFLDVTKATPGRWNRFVREVGANGLLTY